MKKEKFMSFFLFNIVFFLAIGYILYDSFKTYQMKKIVDDEITEIQQKIDEFTERKKIIQGNIERFTEDEKLERIARDRLNLVKEGEVTYKVVE